MSTGQAGDEARATVGVAVPPERAFDIVTLNLLRILASGPMASPPEPNPP